VTDCSDGYLDDRNTGFIIPYILKIFATVGASASPGTASLSAVGIPADSAFKQWHQKGPHSLASLVANKL